MTNLCVSPWILLIRTAEKELKFCAVWYMWQYQELGEPLRNKTYVCVIYADIIRIFEEPLRNWKKKLRRSGENVLLKLRNKLRMRAFVNIQVELLTWVDSRNATERVPSKLFDSFHADTSPSKWIWRKPRYCFYFKWT